MSVAIYARTSMQDQTQIQKQTESLKKYCEVHGWNIAGVYTDSGYSGSDINRPALQALLKDCPQKRFDTVLVYNLDRLSQSQEDALYIVENVFKKSGVSFISMTEDFSGSPFSAK